MGNNYVKFEYMNVNCEYIEVYKNIYIYFYKSEYINVQPQIRKSWDSMENANKKRK